MISDWCLLNPRVGSGWILSLSLCGERLLLDNQQACRLYNSRLFCFSVSSSSFCALHT